MFNNFDISSLIKGNFNKNKNNPKLSSLVLESKKNFDETLKELEKIDRKKDAAAKTMLKSKKDLINWVLLQDHYEKLKATAETYLKLLKGEVSEQEHEAYAKKYETTFEKITKVELDEEVVIIKNKKKIEKFLSDPESAFYRRWFNLRYFSREDHLIDAKEAIAWKASWGTDPLEHIFGVLYFNSLNRNIPIFDSNNKQVNIEQIDIENCDDIAILKNKYISENIGIYQNIYSFGSLIFWKNQRVRQQLGWLNYRSRFEHYMHMHEMNPEIGFNALKTSALFKDIFCKYRDLIDQLTTLQLGQNKPEPWFRERGLKFKKIGVTKEQAKRDAIACLSCLGPEYIANVSKIFQENWIDWDVDKERGIPQCSFAYGGFAKFPIYINYDNTSEGVMALVHEMGHSCNAMFSKNLGIYNTLQTAISEIPGFVNETLLFLYYIDKKYLRNENNERFALIYYFLKRLYNNICENVQYEFACIGLENFLYKEKGFNPTKMIEIYRDACDQFGGLTNTEKQWMNSNDHESYYDLKKFLIIFNMYTNHQTIMYFLGAIVGVSIGIKLYYDNENIVDKYIHFLKKGNTSDPVGALKDLGFDIENKNSYTNLADWINFLLDELCKLSSKDAQTQVSSKDLFLKRKSKAPSNDDSSFILKRKNKQQENSEKDLILKRKR